MKKLIVLLAVFLIIGITPGFADHILAEDTTALHIGSPLILSSNSIKVLDADNPNVVPIIHKDRTLIPLRAVSEHFQAQVDYSKEKREAYINYQDRRYIFPIDKNYYKVEESGKEVGRKVFDTNSLIIENRTMVPLRIIAEDIFKKQVGYRDRIITLGNEEIVIENFLVDEIKSKIGQAIKPANKEELISFIRMLTEERYYNDDTKDESMAPDDEQVSMEESAESEGFSQTNEQIVGINEADVVKTDGKFIYVVTSKSLRVYSSNDGKPVLTDEIKVNVDDRSGTYIEFREIYIDKGKLIVLGIKNNFENWVRPMEESDIENSEEISSFYRPNPNFVYAGIYKVNEYGKLTFEKDMEIEGNLLSSRKKDNFIYLIVNNYIYDYYDTGFRTPMYLDSSQGKEYKEISLDNILYFPKRRNPNYLMIASFNIERADKPMEIEAFLGSGDMVYMSNNYLYVSGFHYNNTWGNITNIARFSFDNGKIGYTGGGMVEGRLLNQFSMDEYMGKLRLATTSWQNQSTNSLFILDEDLNKAGEIKNIALGERIYSVRFIEYTGYIVTFRQIDPLFVIDVSDSTKPAITGELKVTGFSNYLHPVGENTLLGIGKDVDEDTGRQRGIKLSLFDISNKDKPREINNLILGDSGSYAEVLSNHKALMLNLKEDIIAFDSNLTNVLGKYQREYFRGAVIVNVNEEGTLELLKLIPNDGIYGNYTRRIIYIGDILYYINDENIRTFYMESFDEIKN